MIRAVGLGQARLAILGDGPVAPVEPVQLTEAGELAGFRGQVGRDAEQARLVDVTVDDSNSE